MQTSTRTTRPWAAGHHPHAVPDLLDVAIGVDHACAVDLYGVLTRWGDDDTRRTAEAEGPYLRRDESSHTCAVRADGQVTCRGDDPVHGEPHGRRGLMQAAAGPSHACTVEQMTEASGDYNGMTVGQAPCFGSCSPRRRRAGHQRGAGRRRPGVLVRAAGRRRRGRPRRWVRALWGDVPMPEDAYCPDAGAAQVVAAGGNICIRGVDGRVQCGDSLTAFGAEGSGGAWTAYRDIAVGPFVACGVTVDGELDRESPAFAPTEPGAGRRRLPGEGRDAAEQQRGRASAGRDPVQAVGLGAEDPAARPPRRRSVVLAADHQ